MAAGSCCNDESLPGFPARRSSRRSQAVADTLQREISLGQLGPEQALTELELAKRFACSQGTVREALLGLQEDGLVVRYPNRGTRVAPCRAADARSLQRVRCEVECGFLDRVVANAGSGLGAQLEELLDAMRDAARDGDEYLLSGYDREFHARMFRAADLPLVDPILKRCLMHSHRFKILNSDMRRDLATTAERHAPILQALKERDAGRLERLLSHHIMTTVGPAPDRKSGGA